MSAEKPKTASLFDPEALMEAQRRNFTAFTSAGNIVATGMRSYAERQVTMVQSSMQHLWSVMQASAGKPGDDGKWTYENLNGFLANPKGYMSGTLMAFAGLRSAQDRANVIAFLRGQADSPVPLP